MKLALGELSKEGSWQSLMIGDEELEVKIRPFPASQGSMEITEDGSWKVDGKTSFKRFDYCWLDMRTRSKGETEWRPVEDSAGNPIVKLTTEIKKEIFDWADYNETFQEIVRFVNQRIVKMAQIKQGDLRD